LISTRYILKNPLDVLVASFGGVGTTFLSQAIGRFQRLNDPRDLDGYKHCPVPPIFGRPSLKVIYVVGNPVLAAASLFRRGYQAGQAGKLQYSKMLRKYPDQGLSLTNYAIRGRDRFLFQEHFDAWTKEFVFYPTLVVKYEAIHDSISRIAEFLQLPAEFVDGFPPQKERNSTTDSMDLQTSKGLFDMYGGLTRVIEKLPSVYELAAYKSQFSAISDRRYWIGTARDVFWEFFKQQ
jgi:hypothetical protein